MTVAGARRSRGVLLSSAAAMGTVVSIQIVDTGLASDRSHADEAVRRALAWFARVEACCSRFDAASEVSRLAARAGQAVPVSDMLFEAVGFAVAVAKESGGAFDPTVGHQMAARGFNRHYVTGEAVPPAMPGEAVPTFRDLELDPVRRTITLHRPLMLDLGAVAKGLAIDLAAGELRPFADFAIDAGGDLYFAGRNPDDELWTAGIRHPRDPSALIATLRVTDAAVCTSGDYERREGDSHHLLDARTGAVAARTSSATVMAPTAMAADAFGTAAFALGPVEGAAWLERQGVDGLLLSPSLDRFETPALRGRVTWL